MASGKFITFEGGEGAGKSTQIAALRDWLNEQDIKVVLTREPGGCSGAERIRDLLVKGSIDAWSGMSEALMMTAARVEHVDKVIKPALDKGDWVISDRFFDSTIAYQGAGRGIGLDTVRELQKLALGDLQPHMTLMFDLDPAVGLARAGKREAEVNSGEDRFERMGSTFHDTLRQAFLDIASQEPSRCTVIDASHSIEVISELVRQKISQKFELDHE